VILEPAKHRAARPPVGGGARLVAFGLSAALAGCAAVRDGATATPQRPTFSSDTNTTAEGTFEVELGVVVDPGDSFGSPVTLKHGLGERTEVFVGSSPYSHVELPGDDGRGLGDLFVGGRHRVWEGEGGESAAVQIATKLPTADEDDGLGSGETDFFTAGILSGGLGAAGSWTAYGELGWLGDPAGAGTDEQQLVALAVGHALAGEWGAFGELTGISTPGSDDPAFLILGLARSFGPSVVADLSVALGLNEDAPDAQLLVGLTTNLGPAGP